MKKDVCIFCKISSGEVEAFILYENDDFIAFLDVNPVSKGHLLVVPKEHYDDIFTTPDEILGQLNILCGKMGRLCKDKLGADGVNVLNASGKDAQQSVSHLHYHVVPRFKDDGIDLWFPEHTKGKELLSEIQKLLMS